MTILTAIWVVFLTVLSGVLFIGGATAILAIVRAVLLGRFKDKEIIVLYIIFNAAIMLTGYWIFNNLIPL